MGAKSFRRGAVAALVAACLLAAPAAAAVPRGFFGVSAEAPDSADFEAMAAAGFGSFRVPVNWKLIQSSRDGAYDWTSTDRQIVAAEDVGMRPVLVTYGTPAFVHEPPPDGSRGVYPPIRRADLVEWRQFTRALAGRYGPGGSFDGDPAYPGFRPVRTWIIWNEQNAVAYWMPQPDPSQYARMLEFAHAGITGIDPHAEIVLGGMFGYPIASASLKSFAWLRRLYRIDGVKKLFDAVNLHPYASDVRGAIDQIKRFRSVMRRAHDLRTPVVVGEVGWPSASGEEQQAQRFAGFLDRVIARRQKWRIDRVLIYVWRDNPRCMWCPSSGLVGSDGSPKLALARVAAIIVDATARR